MDHINHETIGKMIVHIKSDFMRGCVTSLSRNGEHPNHVATEEWGKLNFMAMFTDKTPIHN
jgi:hypothetical protein